MNCPYCGYYDSRVVDSRDVNDGIRRRRQCRQCELRFTTYERWQPASIFVTKKDRSREEYDREKLMTGIRKACEKRPLAVGSIEGMVDEIEAEIFQSGRNEISSAGIGELVMAGLKKLDHIAYIRFASVYREFADITTLKEEVDTLANHTIQLSSNQLPLLPPEQISAPVRKSPRVRR